MSRRNQSSTQGLVLREQLSSYGPKVLPGPSRKESVTSDGELSLEALVSD